MDTYLEQTVTAPPRASAKLAKVAAWALLVALAGVAVFSLSSILSVTEEIGLKFNFVALIILAASIALGFFVYRSKDKLDTEYDYILSGDTLEVFGVYSEKRRKKLLSLNLSEISVFGGIRDVAFRNESARPGVKKRDFTLNSGAQASYICYTNHNAREIAILELNDEMRSAIEKNAGGGYGAIGGRF